MSRKVSGFSLIEMAIVLVIIGLVGGVALPGLKVMVDRQRVSTTAERQEKILYALASYSLSAGCLPNAACPKHLSGQEDKENQLYRGIVPYVDLGLPESFAKDGHHHWFTYVVEKEYTKVPSQNEPQIEKERRKRSFCRFVKKPDRKSDEQYGGQLTNSQPTLRIILSHGRVVPIAVAVISHGAEGRGAYPQSSNPLPQGEDEIKNTEGTVLVDRPVSQDLQNPFSHKVVWATARNLMGVYGHAPCPSEELPATSSTSFTGNDLQSITDNKAGTQPLQQQDQVLSEQGTERGQEGKGDREFHFNLGGSRIHEPSGGTGVTNRIGKEDY